MHLNDKIEKREKREIDIVNEILSECSGGQDMDKLNRLRTQLWTVLDCKISLPLSELKNRIDSSFSLLQNTEDDKNRKKICKEIAYLASIVKKLLENKNPVLQNMMTAVNSAFADLNSEIAITEHETATKLSGVLDSINEDIFPASGKIRRKIQSIEKPVVAFIQSTFNEEDAEEIITNDVQLYLEEMSDAEKLYEQLNIFDEFVTRLQAIIYQLINNNDDICMVCDLINQRGFCESTVYGKNLYEKASSIFLKAIVPAFNGA
jgi:hypothetical protein